MFAAVAVALLGVAFAGVKFLEAQNQEAAQASAAALAEQQAAATRTFVAQFRETITRGCVGYGCASLSATAQFELANLLGTRLWTIRVPASPVPQVAEVAGLCTLIETTNPSAAVVLVDSTGRELARKAGPHCEMLMPGAVQHLQ